MRDHLAREIHSAEEIRVQRFAPLLDAGSEKSLWRRPAGVGNADVGAAEFLYHRLNEIVNPTGIGHVESLSQDFHLQLPADRLSGSFEFRRIARAHGDTTTLMCKRVSGGQSDALTGAGNNRYSPFQTCIQRSLARLQKLPTTPYSLGFLSFLSWFSGFRTSAIRCTTFSAICFAADPPSIAFTLPAARTTPPA